MAVGVERKGATKSPSPRVRYQADRTVKKKAKLRLSADSYRNQFVRIPWGILVLRLARNSRVV